MVLDKLHIGSDRFDTPRNKERRSNIEGRVNFDEQVEKQAEKIFSLIVDASVKNEDRALLLKRLADKLQSVDRTTLLAFNEAISGVLSAGDESIKLGEIIPNVGEGTLGEKLHNQIQKTSLIH